MEKEKIKGNKDSYTPIHNEILEALCRINLSPYETRILFCIWRKTYGFVDRKTGNRKKFDWISGSQISQMTGLDRRLVSRTLKRLIEKNVISRDDKKTGFSKKFIALMSSVEMTNNKQPQMSSVEMTRVISRDDNLSSVEMHTKEKKENIKEIESFSPVGDIIKKKTGISTEWQDRAFRFAKNLKIELDNNLKSRWLSLFKTGKNIRIQKTYSYLSDLKTFNELKTAEEKIKYFFWYYGNKT